jgi:hypothetical protein
MEAVRRKLVEAESVLVYRDKEIAALRADLVQLSNYLTVAVVARETHAACVLAGRSPSKARSRSPGGSFAESSPRHQHAHTRSEPRGLRVVAPSPRSLQVPSAHERAPSVDMDALVEQLGPPPPWLAASLGLPPAAAGSPRDRT